MELLFHNFEFEHEVRERLNIFDRAITETDALLVTELDLSNFNTDENEIDTLIHFKNLKTLALEMKNIGSSFWRNFPKLEDLVWITWNGPIDFSVFSNMKNLVRLTVSGGDYSSIAFENLDALIPLKNLGYLELHEFGSVDLAPLAFMKQLKSLAVRYSHKVCNITVIATMTQLEQLTLEGLSVDNMDFLDTLPDNIELELCGIQIPSRESINIEKWKRFTNKNICEIEIEKSWEYLNLSSLND